jgi:hypothetical protein
MRWVGPRPLAVQRHNDQLRFPSQKLQFAPVRVKVIREAYEL